MEAFKFATAEVIADPYPMFEATRHLSPVRMTHSGPGEMWTVLSYRHVHEVLRDHHRFSSAGFGDFGSDLFRLVLINDDPPRHTRLRRVVNKSFSRRAIALMQPSIEITINASLDDIGSEPADFMTQFAQLLPLQTILSLVGIPSEDTARFQKWLKTLMHPPGRSHDARTAGIEELVDYLEALIAERPSRASDDALRPLLDFDADSEGFTEAEILGYVILLLVAGTESTAYLVGNAVNLLAHNQQLWDQLRSQPDLVDEFVEETLRLESPVQLLPRRAMEDVELAGATIPKGAIVMVQYGSANRDPNEFDHPDQFRMDRDLNNHVAFGAGIHFCLGSPLARCEAQLTLRALVRRYSRIEPAGQFVRQDSAAGFYGFERLPLRLLSREHRVRRIV